MIHGVLVLVNCMKNNNLAINIFFAIAIALSLILVGKLKPQERRAIAETAPKVETVTEQEELPDNSLQKDRTSTPLSDRPLRMSISVDNPSFLKVRLNDEIKIGDVISDNSIERQRLDRQKKSIKLQIENLNSKTLIVPTPPPPTPLLRNLPPSTFSEELAAISQSQLKLKQSKVILANRSKLLTTDNPERRAEFEKAGASLAIASQKIQEQEQMIVAMQDMKMQSEILQHEQSKLKKLQSELEQARSEVDREQAKLNNSAILQSQELEREHINFVRTKELNRL
jgi:hypothetical protein